MNVVKDRLKAFRGAMHHELRGRRADMARQSSGRTLDPHPSCERRAAALASALTTRASAAALALALVLLGVGAPAQGQEPLETLTVLPGTTAAKRVTTETELGLAPSRLVITGYTFTD